MKKKLLLISGIVFLVVAFIVLNYSETSTPHTGIDFTYTDLQKIKTILNSKNIFVSSPTIISDDTVNQYCMYFDDKNKQQIMNTCLTTSVTDINGNPLGNINIGGDSQNALMAVALLESSPLLDSKFGMMESIFEAMISVLVCDCWEEKHPGGFESVKHWMQAAKEHHVDSGRDSTKSRISGLVEKEIVLEITKTRDSYLWTLIIIK